MMNSNGLPQGWEEVELFKYLDLVPSGVKQFLGMRNYIDTGSLETGRINDFVEVDYETRPSRANMEARENDILFAKMKGTEKVYIISKEDSNNIYSTGFAILRVRDKSKLSPKYVYFWLRTKEFQNLKNKESTGATQKAINETKLKTFTIITPPLKTQQKIVSILEKAEETVKYREAANTLAGLLPKSIFLEMFGDPVNNPRKWGVKCIKDLGEVRTGNTPSRKVQRYYGDYIEWIKSDNLNTPYTYATKSSEMLSQEGARKGRIAPKGSILVTCIAGSLSCIGNAAIVNRDVAFNQQINAIIPKNGVNSLFVYYLIVNSKEYIQRHSTQSMKGLLSKSKFENIPIIFPPVDLQNKFGKITEVTEALNEKQEKSNREIENLFNTLMQKAFAGELVA